MNRFVMFLALAACSPSPATIQPRSSCGAPCNSSTQCGDFFGGCRVCFNSVCTSSLPAQPTPADAGTDSMKGHIP